MIFFLKFYGILIKNWEKQGQEFILNFKFQL